MASSFPSKFNNIIIKSCPCSSLRPKFDLDSGHRPLLNHSLLIELIILEVVTEPLSPPFINLATNNYQGQNVLPLFYELRRKGKSLQESNDVHPQKSVESSNYHFHSTLQVDECH